MIPVKVESITVSNSEVLRRIIFPGLLLVCLYCISINATAEWKVVAHKSEDLKFETNVAYINNSSGYTLEIYRDTNNIIRSKFLLPSSLIRFADKSCPTYQIDRGSAVNRSINGAPCLAHNQWSEFIIGSVDNNQIASSTLLALMNGISISFRFRLANNGYRETKFSLQGSKRAMLEAFGQGITISASSP